MKKFCRVFLSLLIVASMLIATAVAASAKTADPVGPTPDPGDGHTHTWTVSFTWNINAPKRIYKATATFTCTGCGLTSTRTANVTVAGTTCTALPVPPLISRRSARSFLVRISSSARSVPWFLPNRDNRTDIFWIKNAPARV